MINKLCVLGCVGWRAIRTWGTSWCCTPCCTLCGGPNRSRTFSSCCSSRFCGAAPRLHGPHGQENSRRRELKWGEKLYTTHPGNSGTKMRIMFSMPGTLWISIKLTTVETSWTYYVISWSMYLLKMLVYMRCKS